MKLTAIQKTMMFLLVVFIAGVLAAWHIFKADMSVFWALLNYMGPHFMFAGVMFYLCVRPAVKPDDSGASCKRWCVACHNYH